ncbi:MAG: hypothetical protein O9302_00235 [Cyclobacteriaceae bacterium]|jgi:hypothetical protein|nr:hypothetical protein [Cytophagales bacterium]MCZ8326458.1 hypothetical protein [Cyclobacteriaceae bacterium]
MQTLKKNLKTFEDACSILGVEPSIIPAFDFYPEQDRKAMQAHAKLVIIARAANQITNKNKPWQPDWNNDEQGKYYPWFYMGGSSGFRYRAYDLWGSYSDVGSRLCFIDYDTAKYVGEQFIDLYKEYFLM